MADERERALQNYRRKLQETRLLESKLKNTRQKEKDLQKEYEKSENDLKALQSVGQIVGEVLKQLTDEKFIVKATNGPRYVVGCRRQVDKNELKAGTRVALDMTTLTIMRYLPREVDPLVYNMSHEDPGNISYSEIGGLSDQVRELREVIELPLNNPELFQRVGISPPKGCLLYGPPGTGKTLLARAVASQLDANFLKVVSSAIVDKYIGESARLIREMFNYARDHQPCIIFMDEIDAIGGRRFSEGTSADREIQRYLYRTCAHARAHAHAHARARENFGDMRTRTHAKISSFLELWSRPALRFPHLLGSNRNFHFLLLLLLPLNICLGSALGGSSGVANGRYGKKFKLPVSPIPVNSRMHGSEEKRITLKEIFFAKNIVISRITVLLVFFAVSIICFGRRMPSQHEPRERKISCICKKRIFSTLAAYCRREN
ncbi:unnamed protein product [Oikopleura dioica]|uniref:AAA+ ATPase domain-containing protein n=1 Tax=Oikopleura dioica TaxID=34765 RepID=E4XTW6_OIKDI|nr:unnamed protein product [Oikopleura dioica]